MDIEEKIHLVKQYPVNECITDTELRELFQTKEHLKHYIGFEISGKVHLGTGLMTSIKIKDLQKAGVKTTVFLADYHAWINNKFGGDLDKIQKVAKEYFIPCMKSLGLEACDFVLASELYENTDYWKKVLNITKNTTMNRMLRCTTIMGRNVSDLSSDSSLIIYPAMQCADILQLDVDIMHGGMDQRKVHMLYRDLREKIDAPNRKRVAIHTKLLMSLQGPKRMGFEEDEKLDVDISSKMSKSNPLSCIFVHDSEEDIQKKIREAYCLAGDTYNPINELAEAMIHMHGTLKIERKQKFGGDIEYTSIDQLNSDFKEKSLHPFDLKNAVARYLIKTLEPVRTYFKGKEELIKIADGKQI